MVDLRFTVTASKQGDRLVRFIASTTTVDRAGTKLLPEGCRYDNFLKNPVFLAVHDRDSLDSVLGLVRKIEINSAVEITVEFDTTPEAEKAYQRVLKGFLRAVSVGFRAKKQTPTFDTMEDEEAYIQGGGIVTVTEWELVEVSLVPIGSNPDALIANRSFGLSSKLRVASVLCLNSAGKQLWGKRNDSGLYTTPGGKLAVGENPLLGACREVYEEAGVTVQPSQLRFLGLVDLPKARVYCYSVTLPDSVNVSGINDPDKEVTNWEWLDNCPADQDLHAKPNALVKWARWGSLRIFYAQSRTITNQSLNEVVTLDATTIFSKLGITEGAKPEEISAALVKYLAGPDADADKQALVMGLLGMLTPAAAATSTETPAPSPAEGMELALKAAQDEMAAMRAEMDEMRKRAEAPKAEDKPAADDSEERADKACKAGQWPMSKRADLVKQYQEKKTPYLFKEGTFSTRGVNYTQGGNPLSLATQANPRLGEGTTARGKVRTDVQNVFALASRRIAASTGVKQG